MQSSSDVTKSRYAKKAITHDSWQRAVCRAKYSTLYKQLGRWQVDEFKAATPDEQVEFYR